MLIYIINCIFKVFKMVTLYTVTFKNANFFPPSTRILVNQCQSAGFGSGGITFPSIWWNTKSLSRLDEEVENVMSSSAWVKPDSNKMPNMKQCILNIERFRMQDWMKHFEFRKLVKSSLYSIIQNKVWTRFNKVQWI